MVGQGAYGEVALVEDVNTHKRYAMKLIERGYKVRVFLGEPGNDVFLFLKDCMSDNFGTIITD